MSQNTTAMQRGAGGETTGATDMTTQQPEAIKLAERCEHGYPLTGDAISAAAELRRQHARITELEAQLAQRFDAADMATASAQGFRDGVASLSANAVEPRNAIDRDALIDAIAQGLHGTWHCTRVWEAWHVGTMSQDDFEPVDESETPTEIADAVLVLLAAPPTAQQGAAYAALPESFLEIPDVQDESGINAYYSREVVLECIDAALASHGQALASKIEGLTAAQESLGVEFEKVLHDNLFDLYEESPQTASRGQAPAGAAPSAGAVAGPDDIDAIALTRYKVVHSHDSMFHRFAVVAGDGKQQLYLGRETECQNMTRKFAGAFLDGAFYQSQIAAAPTPQPTQAQAAKQQEQLI